MEGQKQKSTGKTVVIIILTILLIGTLGYIGYDKFFSINSCNIKKTDTTSKIESNEDNSVNTIVSKPKCSGIYYGEYTDTSIDDVLTSDLKYKYVLNDDGTYVADFSGVSGSHGVFIINDNTISFTGMKDTTGPREEDPHYLTSDYVIADDCSYILIKNSNVSFKINRQ